MRIAREVNFRVVRKGVRFHVQRKWLWFWVDRTSSFPTAEEALAYLKNMDVIEVVWPCAK